LIVPQIRGIFKLEALNLEQWKLVILLSLVPIAVVEIIKLLGFNSTKAEKTGH